MLLNIRQKAQPNKWFLKPDYLCAYSYFLLTNKLLVVVLEMNHLTYTKKQRKIKCIFPRNSQTQSPLLLVCMVLTHFCFIKYMKGCIYGNRKRRQPV